MSDQSAPAARRPVDASMTLLNEMMRRPLDPGYAAEADARERAGRPRTSGTRTPMLLLTAVVIGFLVAVAALSLRVPTTAAAEAKQRLIAQIESRQADGDRQAATIAALRAQIQQAQQQALVRGHESQLAEQLTATARGVGAVPLTGPGVLLTIDDARPDQAAADGDVDPRTQTEENAGRVTSGDLQIIVNGLWKAGAEAVSINGQRLTAQSAIRFAGEAILVNFRPLTRPYVITAIGDPDTMPTTFSRGSGGHYLSSLQETFGIQATVKTEQSLQVPASPSLQLRVAKPVPTRSTTSTPPTTPTSEDAS
ncbi:DUF881 domain-containing protein [Segeticoccus rhizosphaerae]|uniref:DUF881 domain-containing protein n=1 Tax=Segeticoccus rhizosphaerae TaxID=1104777 RepID=UPI001EEFA211|nr:DUF881 domain-containing protein [Segeticoccus rhizosphaerae]